MFHRTNERLSIFPEGMDPVPPRVAGAGTHTPAGTDQTAFQLFAGGASGPFQDCQPAVHKMPVSPFLADLLGVASVVLLPYLLVSSLFNGIGEPVYVLQGFRMTPARGGIFIVAL